MKAGRRRSNKESPPGYQEASKVFNDGKHLNMIPYKGKHTEIISTQKGLTRKQQGIIRKSLYIVANSNKENHWISRGQKGKQGKPPGCHGIIRNWIYRHGNHLV